MGLFDGKTKTTTSPSTSATVGTGTTARTGTTASDTRARDDRWGSTAGTSATDTSRTGTTATDSRTRDDRWGTTSGATATDARTRDSRWGKTAGTQSTLTANLSQRLSDSLTTSSTSGRSSTTTRSGLDDPTLLNPVLDRLPGMLQETLASLSSNPYLTQAQSLAGDLVPEELTPLISRIMDETTPAGYEAARQDTTRDFLDTVGAIGHRAAALGPAGANYQDATSDRARDQFSRNLLSSFDRSQNERTGLIADLIGQRTGATSNAINQLLGLDRRITMAPTEALGAYSNILATLPLTKKQVSDTRSSSTTTSRSQVNELLKSLTGTRGTTLTDQLTGGVSETGTRGTTTGATRAGGVSETGTRGTATDVGRTTTDTAGTTRAGGVSETGTRGTSSDVTDNRFANVGRTSGGESTTKSTPSIWDMIF